MLNLLRYLNIRSLGIILIFSITFTMLVIIIQIVNLLYLKRKLKEQLKDLKGASQQSVSDLLKHQHLSLNRRKLTNPSSFKLSLSGPLTKQLNLYCLRNKITKSFYLETLLTESLIKGSNYNLSNSNLKVGGSHA